MQRQMSVRVLPPWPQAAEPLRFLLSEPAYVAAFMVYPGAGVQLIYPEIGKEQQLYGGFNAEPLITLGFDADAVNAVLGPRGMGPSYLYVVASRRPLDIGRYVHRPLMLNVAIGNVQAHSFYPDVAIDALLEHVVSLGDETSWDTDVYMIWPMGDGFQLQNPVALRRLACADGSSMTVPFDYPFAGCPGQFHNMPNSQLLQAQRARLAQRVPTLAQRLTYSNARLDRSASGETGLAMRWRDGAASATRAADTDPSGLASWRVGHSDPDRVRNTGDAPHTWARSVDESRRSTDQSPSSRNWSRNDAADRANRADRAAQYAPRSQPTYTPRSQSSPPSAPRVSPPSSAPVQSSAPSTQAHVQ